MSNFDKILKEKLSGYTEAPPSYILDKLKNDLIKINSPKKINYTTYGTIAVASIAIISAILFYTLEDNTTIITENNNTIINTVAPENKTETLTNQPEEINNAVFIKSAEIEYISESKNICGLEININKSNSNGEWVYDNNNLSIINNKVFANNYGEYYAKWVNKVDNQIMSEITYKLNFIKPIKTFAGDNQKVCENTCELSAQSGIEGFWSALNNNSNIENCNKATTLASTSTYGIKTFVWNVNKEKCYLNDTVGVNFIETPQNKISVIEPYNLDDKLIKIAITDIRSYFDYKLSFDNKTISLDREINGEIELVFHNEAHDIILEVTNDICKNKDVLVLDPESFDVNINVKASTCNLDNGKAIVFISGKDSFKYKWNDGSIEKDRYNLQSGNYELTVIKDNIYSRVYDVEIKDSGIVRAGFYHEELGQQIDMPLYFYNSSTIDGEILANNSSKVEWSFGDNIISQQINPEHIYKTSGDYIVKLYVTSNVGCVDSAIIKDISISGSLIDLPNVFSPNGDGINDVFIPKTKSLSSFSCIIINNSGEEVYRWNDPMQGWDGKLKSENYASAGIYYYIAIGIGLDGKRYQYKSFFYLVK